MSATQSVDNRRRASRPIRHVALRPDLVRALAFTWIAVSLVAYGIDLMRQTRQGLSNGLGRPFGDDFINYWSGPVLAWTGRAGEVYAWAKFHAFEQEVAGAPLDFYHYSYPPVALLLTAPLALLPYVPALGVWLVASWLAFVASLRTAMQKGAWLLAAATPAVFVNALGGQNGTWTAALLGGGFSLLERRPALAGILFGLLVFKPHLALMIPVALLATRQWRTIAFAGLTAGGAVALSALAFGRDLWADYAIHANVLRAIILEDSTGVWHRMISVFVFARRIGFDVGPAYGLQLAVGLAAAATVATAWFRRGPTSSCLGLALLGTCLATPYLQDYDLVFGAFLVPWLLPGQGTSPSSIELDAVVVIALVLALPVLAAPIGTLTGLAAGPLFLVPAFILVARRALVDRSADAMEGSVIGLFPTSPNSRPASST